MSMGSSILKLVAPGGGMFLLQSLSGADAQVTVGFVGVPVNLIVACALGAYASFSFGDPVSPRSRMLNLFVACVIVGCAFTAITNAAIEHFLRVNLLPGVQAGIGAILSCLSRFIIPAVIERIPRWLDKIPFLRKGQGE